jgi:predicted nucleic acid-binding protein
MTSPAIDVVRNRKEKALNLYYRQMVGQRVECLLDLDRKDEAKAELDQLHDDLSSTGANAPVLSQIRTLASQLETTDKNPTQKLWERVRAQDQKAEKEARHRSRALEISAALQKRAKKIVLKKSDK